MSAPLLSWIFLLLSIATEVVGMLSLNHSKGFMQILPTFGALISFLSSIWLMSLAIKHLESGLIYAIWAGSTTAILAVIGVIWLNESISSYKIAGVIFTIIGVVLLNLGETHA